MLLLTLSTRRHHKAQGGAAALGWEVDLRETSAACTHEGLLVKSSLVPPSQRAGRVMPHRRP